MFRRLFFRIALISGMSVLLALPLLSQQRPPYEQQNPYGYGDRNQYSSKITEQPIVQYADPSSAVLQWRTNGDMNTFARVGVDPNNLDIVIRSSGDDNPHYARLNNQLRPGQTYFFQVYDPRDNPLTPVLAFQTPVQGVMRDVPAQLAANMASRGYRGDRDWDRDRDRDRDRDQYASGLPQSDYGYRRGYGPEQSGATVRIIDGPRVRYNGNGSAVVTWTTNVPASAVVHFGTEPNNLDQRAEAPWGGTNHTVTINNLNPGLDYFVQVESAQAQGTGTGITSPLIPLRHR